MYKTEYFVEFYRSRNTSADIPLISTALLWARNGYLCVTNEETEQNSQVTYSNSLGY